MIILIVTFSSDIGNCEPQYPVVPIYVSHESGRIYDFEAQPLPSETKIENKFSIYSGGSDDADQKINCYKYQKSKFSNSSKIITIYLEIINKGDELTDIIIKEEVDPHLVIVDFLDKPQKFDPFIESPLEFLSEANETILNKIIYKWDDNYSINKSKNYIYIRISRLDPKERIKYSYEIMPNETGIFDSRTIVRIGGNYIDCEDYDYPLKIKWEPPVIEVTPIKDLSYTYIGQPFNVTYSMVYKTESTTDPIKCNVSFKIPDNYEYYIYENNKLYRGDNIEKIFYPLAHSITNITVVYNQSGLLPLPEVMIEGVPAKIISQIDVYPYRPVKWAEDNYPFLSALGIITAIIFSGYSLYSPDNNRRNKRKRFGISHNIDINNNYIINDKLDLNKNKRQLYICKCCGKSKDESANEPYWWH